MKVKTENTPILNTKHLIIFKGNTFAQNETVRSLTVYFFHLLFNVNKAETNWRNVKTKRDIKFSIRRIRKGIRLISYKWSFDFGWH